jgi:hypothetical protein
MLSFRQMRGAYLAPRIGQAKALRGLMHDSHMPQANLNQFNSGLDETC